MKKSRSYLFLLAAGFLLMAGAMLFSRWSVSALPEIADSATRSVEARAMLCREALAGLFAKEPTERWQQLDRYYDENRIGLYLWEKDSIVFWNNSQIPLKNSAASFQKPQGLVKLTQGYYVYFREVKDGNTAIALCLLKPSYELQNNYLKNDFREWTGIPRHVKIDTTYLSPYKISLAGQDLFSIKGDDALYYNQQVDNSCFVFFSLGFLLLLIALLKHAAGGASPTGMGMWLLAVVLFRGVMMLAEWPAFFTGPSCMTCSSSEMHSHF